MFCKTITYTDFDGNERTEDHYFNLTEAEVIEWLSTNSDYTIDKVLDNMKKKMDVKGILESTKALIYMAYGEKSLDGRRFIKTPEVKANFMETNAYSVLFMELATDAKKAAEFVNALIPKTLNDKIKAIKEEHGDITTEQAITIIKESK